MTTATALRLDGEGDGDGGATAPILIPAIAADGSLYRIEKMEAHRRGDLHLAVSVFAFRAGRLLVQRRALGKYHSGGQWANTVCTHPHWGEAPDASARRRLREELGVVADVRATATIEYRADVGAGLIEHERVQVFRADLADGARLDPDPDEVSEIAWAEPDELARRALDEPEAFAPWFRIYLRRWAELNLS